MIHIMLILWMMTPIYWCMFREFQKIIQKDKKLKNLIFLKKLILNIWVKFQKISKLLRLLELTGKQQLRDLWLQDL